MIEINTKELYENWQEIITTTNKDGIILPYLLTEFQIPSMFDFTDKEHKKLLKQNKNLNKTKQQYIERRITENTILNGKGNVQEKLNNYYEKELLEWLKKYPEYNNIILKK